MTRLALLLSPRVVGWPANAHSGVRVPIQWAARAVTLAALIFLPGCALLRSPASQTTPTSANGARVVVVVFALWAPHVVGLDQSGPVGGSAGPQSAEQRTDVKADADVKIPGVP